MTPGERRALRLKYKGVPHEAVIEIQNRGSVPTRLLWKKSLADEINNYLVDIVKSLEQGKVLRDYKIPLIEFIRQSTDTYEIILRYKGHEIEKRI